MTKAEKAPSYEAGYHRGTHPEYDEGNYSGMALYPMYLEWLVSAAEDGYYVTISCYNSFAAGYTKGREDTGTST